MDNTVAESTHVPTPRTNLLLRGLLLNSTAVGAMGLVSAWASIQLPPGGRFPIHWNAAGQVDRYGSRFETLWLLPVIAIGTGLLLTIIPEFEPRLKHIRQSGKAYTIIIGAVMAMLFVMHVTIVMSALGHPIDMNKTVGLAMGFMFVVMGNYMGKIRSNFIAGIRTPWTLSSELSWNKTHRLGGKLFMLTGLVAIAVALTESNYILNVLLSLLPLSLLLTVYSYLVWKSDPRRVSQE